MVNTYIGLSQNADKQLEAHNKRLSFWTKRYKNWKRVYLKQFALYFDARKWEIYLKKQKKGHGFKRMLLGDEGVS
jgi:predicted GIY-YIG superfamily endonuclease